MKLPEVIAHRGMPREHPENTLPGFAQALEAGVQGIELDVHATRDGVVVVHHDPVVAAPETREAHAAPSPLRIDQLSFDELRRLDGARGIPPLAQVLSLVDGRARVYVEVKATGIEDRVIDLVEPRADWCAIHSFDHRIVAAIRRAAPVVRCGVLMSSYLVHPLAPLRDTGALDLWQHWSMIDEPLVGAVQAEGGRVIAWTVNDVAVAATLRSLGVDGICTDTARDLVPLVRH